MTKKKLKKIIVIVAMPIVLIMLVFFIGWLFQPLFLRYSYLERITRLEIPRTAQIVEYRFGITTFGAEPFFAKLELSQEEHDVLIGHFGIHPDFLTDEYLDWYLTRSVDTLLWMKRVFDYNYIGMDDIAEMGWTDISKSIYTIFPPSGSSRHVNVLIVTTNNGQYFLYVFYH